MILNLNEDNAAVMSDCKLEEFYKASENEKEMSQIQITDQPMQVCSNNTLLIFSAYHICSMRGSRGGQVVRTISPLKNHKNIGFPSNIVPDPLTIRKLPSQHSMLGHHRHASETLLKWSLAGGLMMACLKWYLNSPSPSSTKKNFKVGPL